MFGASVYILTPLTDFAKDWIEDNIDPNAQRFGRGIAIEHRYIEDIIYGMEGSGLLQGADFTVHS